MGLNLLENASHGWNVSTWNSKIIFQGLNLKLSMVKGITAGQRMCGKVVDGNPQNNVILVRIIIFSQKIQIPVKSGEI